MIETDKVKAFFDCCADTWDKEMIRDDSIIEKILDIAGVSEQSRVLDVACGTGVLFPDYLKRKVKSVCGVDLSEKMIHYAEQKIPDERFTVLCADIYALALPQKFDVVMVYNAFPHFEDPEKLIAVLSGFLCPGGRLCIAHGMSRKKINAHHRAAAAEVSESLMSEMALSELFSPFFTVDTVIANEKMYLVAGNKRSTVKEHKREKIM